MCSIFGLGFFGKDVKLNSFLLRNILRNLAKKAQARGTDATGLAFTTSTSVNVFKHNVSASEFIELENYREVARKYTNSRTNLFSILGHCRMKTLGTELNPLNNHPIVANNIVGVHNGVIGNHYTVFNTLRTIAHTRYKVERAAEVDSEAIFRAIDCYAYSNKHPMDEKGRALIGHVANPVTKAIQSTAEILNGSFTCALVDTENPECLWIFKHGNPVTIYIYEKEGFMAFASLEQMIVAAVGDSPFSKPKILDIANNTGVCFNLKKGKYSNFDMKENIGRMNYLGY